MPVAAVLCLLGRCYADDVPTVPMPRSCGRRTMIAKTFLDTLGYTKTVPRTKPIRRENQDLRDLATYTIPEAARYLGIAPRTAQYWFRQRNHILQPSFQSGDVSLLSFRDATEAYVLAVLTRFYGFSLQTLREIISNSKKETGLERPLIDADLSVLFKSVILEKSVKGKHSRQMIDVSKHRNLVFPEFVDQLGKRIIRDEKNSPSRIYPWRLITTTDDSKPVSMDPQVMSGRLVVTGTRVPVTVLVRKRMLGKSIADIARSFGLSIQIVEKALDHIERPIPKKVA
jgi:uncharacterized protein (DUF433 family)